MAVKRIGFLDNFSGGYVRSGPRAGSPYYQTVGAAQNRDRYGRGAGLFARSDALNQRHQLGAYARPKVNTETVATPPPAPAAPAASAPPAVTLDDPAITSDPVLLKVRKLASGQRDDAATSALARKKQLAIQTGDAGLAREFGLDDTVAQLAAQNPLSNLAVIRDQARLSERGFNEEANKANLFYSGYRGEQLGELAKALLTAEAQAQARAREGFSGIEAELLGAGSAADQLEMQAEADAYARAVAAGLGGGTADAGAGAGAGGPAGQQSPGDDALVPLRQFDANDPYYGSGLAAIAAELLSIPGRGRKPDPLLEALLR